MLSALSTTNLARASARRPWWTVGAWIVLFVVAGMITGMVGLDSTTDVTLENNPESVRGWDLLTEHNLRDERPMTETVIVRSESTTVDDPAFQQTVQSITDALRGNGEVVAGATNYYEVGTQDQNAAAGLVSADKSTTIIPVTLVGNIDTAIENAPKFLDTLDAQREGAAGFQLLTVGDGSLNDEINTITEEDLVRGEGIGIGFALIILVVVFAALVAAGLPIILAIVAISIATGVTVLISQFGELSFFVTNMITMIGLAVGIDYSLFIVERYREERRHNVPKQQAIAIAGSTASRAVFFSGMTVVLAVAGLFILPNNIYRSLSIGAIAVVVVAVLATLTLIPALLSLLGDRIDWPRRRHYGEVATIAAQERWDHETIHAGFWGTVTRVVMRRPVISVVAATALLLLAASPFLDVEYGLAGASTLPDNTRSKEAYEILGRDFSAGLVAPVEIVVDGPVNDPAVQAGIDQFIQTLSTEQTDAGTPLFGPATVTRSEDGQLALISVPLKIGPDEPAAFSAIHHLRDSVVPPAEQAMPGTQLLVTGQTANSVDFLSMRDTYTPYVFAFVLGLSFLLLLLVFRSLVIAIKAIILNLLSVSAAYGLLVLVFQKGYGADLFGFQTVEAIEAWLPLFLFSVLFGLSMDYHVFLLSRIKEHWDQTGRNAESVAVGLQATAKIITGAALIMVAVFGGFAAGRLTFLQQVGFGLGTAVLLDATIVRSILVPSAMALLGRWNWYLPSWLNWLPNLSIEAPRHDAPAPAASDFKPAPAPSQAD